MKCEPELSHILAGLFNMCLKDSCFLDCWKVSSMVLSLFKDTPSASCLVFHFPLVLKILGKRFLLKLQYLLTIVETLAVSVVATHANYLINSNNIGKFLGFGKREKLLLLDMKMSHERTVKGFQNTKSRELKICSENPTL